MLEHLSVRDFALIDEAEVDFSRGLILFTGETGAGKSLVVGALGFLFGGRGDVGLIREGAEECTVSASLNVAENAAAAAWLQERDIPEEEGAVVLRRGLRDNGRSYAYIQNRAVSRSDMADFTALIADIHGQHEHQALLNRESHIDALDDFAELRAEREDYRIAYEAWTDSLKKYRERLAEAERRQREEDFLKYVAGEIEAAKIKTGEDEELIREERILSQHEKLFDAVKTAAEAFSLREGTSGEGALGALRRARQGLDAAREIDPELSELSERLENAYLDIEDAAESLSAYMEKLRFDPQRLESIENRLAELRRLKKKYGPSLDDVIARGEKDRAALLAFSSWEQEKSDMEKAIAALKKNVVDKADSLSRKRKAAALDFSARVETILANLGMAAARLPFAISTLRNPEGKLLLSPKGMDSVEFLIAPNIGEAPRALAKIASGGELSRVALAIKTVLSSKDSVDTLIFDEIDAGIGGEVAAAVAVYLKAISSYRQVLCVTHLAAIAARADTHYRVDKRVEGGRTVTRIDRMEGKEREEEIARMLAGDKEGSASLAHAAELLRRSLAG